VNTTVVPVYTYRTHETVERLAARGITVDELDVDLAIASAVTSLHEESERGGWPDPDDEHTWARYVEPRVLDRLDIDPDVFGEAFVAHDRPAEIGAAL
jgi:hypothetical protein